MHRAVWRRVVASARIGALLAALPAAAAAQDEEERARQVYQIFKDRCLECHGETGKGELDLRTHATMMKGGMSGDVIVPHQPGKSLLYLLVSHAEEPPMPRKKPKLGEADIELIRRWIEDGASLEAVEEAVPDAARTPEALLKAEERPITDQDRHYWAFQKPARHAVPVVASAAWQRNPIDAYLLSGMAAKGLTPAPKADRRTLIRRAYLDLLGLPPTPEQIDAFVADPSPDAWPKLVDSLLASVH
jgi:mono/diheme cytochrome c family protein